MAALLVQIIALTITQFTVLVSSQALVGEFFKHFFFFLLFASYSTQITNPTNNFERKSETGQTENITILKWHAQLNSSRALVTFQDSIQ